MTDYTVTVYYTRTFKQHTADPNTFIDQVRTNIHKEYLFVLINF